MCTTEIEPATVVEIPPQNNNTAEEEHETSRGGPCEESSKAATPASAPSSLGSGSEKPAAVWEGINWSHARGGNNTRHHHHNRSRSLSETSNSSLSSTDESSRSSVDLLDEHLKNQEVFFVPTMAALPSNATAAASASHNTSGGTFNNPYQQRPRRPTELSSQSSSGVSGSSSGSRSSRSSNGIGDSSMMMMTSNSVLSIQRQSGPRSPQQASITARSRRSLFFLFLIAFYTTFGLTVHNLPVTPELEFTRAGGNLEPATTTSMAAVSADVLPENMDDLSKAQLRTPSSSSTSNRIHNQHHGGAGGIIQNHMAFARRTNQQQQKQVFVRARHPRQEIKDFYQQQALAEHVDYSFFINCGVLVLVALWAWRERRNCNNAGGAEKPFRAAAAAAAGGGDERVSQ